jgi:hypothetical protein
LIAAMSFNAHMAAFKTQLEHFMDVRREFLVAPKSAAFRFCSGSNVETTCTLDIKIRVAGIWDGLCKHQDAATFYAERFYLLSLQCRNSLAGVYTHQLPALKSLIKR